MQIDFKLAAPSRLCLYWASPPAMRVVQALYSLKDTLPSDGNTIRKKLGPILQDRQHGNVIKNGIAARCMAVLSPLYLSSWDLSLLISVLFVVVVGAPNLFPLGAPKLVGELSVNAPARRRQLVEMRVAEGNRLEQASTRTVRRIKSVLKTLDEQIEEIDSDADRHLKLHFKDQRSLLDSVKGVGPARASPDRQTGGRSAAGKRLGCAHG